MELKECNLLSTVTSAKRGPGRPRKDEGSEKKVKMLELKDITDSPMVGKEEEVDKRKRNYWFHTPFIHDILYAYSVEGSGYKAKKWLEHHRPKLPTEKEWRFEHLAPSTIDGWYKEGKLLPLYEEMLNDVFKYSNGRPSVLSNHSEIKHKIDKSLELFSEKIRMGINQVKIIMEAVLLKEKPELLNELKLTAGWISKYCRRELGWKWRRGTTGAGNELPENWHEEGIKVAKRLAVMIYNDEIHRKMIINFDQTGVHVVPKSRFTYAKAKTEHVSILGFDDKRQITMVVGCTYDGDLLPLQIIFQGTDKKRLNQLYSHPFKPDFNIKNEGFHITCSPSHWSTFDTMKEYIKKIIVPWMDKMKKEYSTEIKSDAKCVVILDCWNVHRGEEFRSYMKQNHQDIILLFIPPHCTSRLQVADVVLNFPFKFGIKKQFEQWSLNILMKEFEKDETQITAPNLGLTILKPLLVEWAYHSWNKIKTGHGKLLIQKGFKQCITDFYDPFDINNQKIASKEALERKLEIYGEIHDKDDEKENPDGYESESTDEDNDELDIMQKRVDGTRKSQRIQKQVNKPENMIATDQLQFSEDEEEI